MDKTHLNQKIERYRQAAVKAVDFQIKHQLLDGGYIWEGYAPDAFHKQAYSWAMSGYYGHAHRLLNWVKANCLEPDGQLKEYDSDVYKHSWFLQGAHRLGRFDLSYPVMSFLETCQAACGGLPHFAKVRTRSRSLNSVDRRVSIAHRQNGHRREGGAVLHQHAGAAAPRIEVLLPDDERGEVGHR